jgi:WD40 repeat protein
MKVGLVILYLIPEKDPHASVQIFGMLADKLEGELIRSQLARAATQTEIFNIFMGLDGTYPPGFRLVRTLTGHSDVVHAVAWSPEGRYVASAGAGPDHDIKIWDAESGQLHTCLQGHGATVFGLAWRPHGGLLASGAADKTIRLWDTDTFKRCETLESYDEVYGVAWQPLNDSYILASAGHRFMARLWDARLATPLPMVEGGINIGYCVEWSPDGRWVASGGGRMEPSVRVWDAKTKRSEVNLTVSHGSVYALSWSPDGKSLVAGTADGSVLVYDVTTWRFRRFQGHTAQLTAVSHSHDGRMIASKADDDTVRLWDSGSGDELCILSEPGGCNRLLCGLAFHPQGSRLATLGVDGMTIRLWELDIHKLRIRERIGEVAGLDDYTHRGRTLREKQLAGEYDVFVAYNSMDREAALTIARRLKDRSILPWVDEWDLCPGEPWIETLQKQLKQLKSAAVFVGDGGIGPWERMEVNALLQQFVQRGCRVIPVILSGCRETPELPLFLKSFPWVDFRREEPDPMARLIWGITGQRPT